MTSCGGIGLLKDLGPIWEPRFPPIGSHVNNISSKGKNLFLESPKEQEP